MDILFENLPQTLPETRRPSYELNENDPFDIVAAMYEPGMSPATLLFHTKLY